MKCKFTYSWHDGTDPQETPPSSLRPRGPVGLFRQSDRRRFSTCSNLLWYITNTVSAACDCHFTCLLLIEKQTEPLKPDPTSSLTGQHVNEGIYHSSTSGCSSDGGTVWCCSLQQWVRVLNTSISVQLFVAFCVSSFVILCVADLQVFIIVNHPESKCVSQKTSALTPRRLNKTRLWTRSLEPNKINDSPPQRNTKTVESDNNYSDLLF